MRLPYTQCPSLFHPQQALLVAHEVPSRPLLSQWHVYVKAVQTIILLSLMLSSFCFPILCEGAPSIPLNHRGFVMERGGEGRVWGGWGERNGSGLLCMVTPHEIFFLLLLLLPPPPTRLLLFFFLLLLLLLFLFLFFFRLLLLLFLWIMKRVNVN